MRGADGTTYTEQLTYCDGSISSIRDTKTCTVAAYIFNLAPYSLAWGSEVYAHVIATNLYGDSLTSLAANGGIIVRVPDKPVTLVERYSDRTPTVLGLTWADGVENGGLAVLDYRVNIAELGGSYTVFQSGIVSQSFVVTGLTSGKMYKFKVEARNSHGYSDYSDEVTLLAAFKPEAPTTVTTTVSGPNVIIQWSEPLNNGSPITGYKVFIVEHNSAIFT